MIYQIRGGDGDALDILQISKHTSIGTVIKLELIGVFVLSDNGVNYTKVIVIPVEVSLQLIGVNPYSQFSENYAHIKEIIKIWFLGYKVHKLQNLGDGDTKILRR